MSHSLKVLTRKLAAVSLIFELQSAIVSIFFSLKKKKIFAPLSTQTCLSVLSPQLTFTEAMRNKARLSITGSVGENGRVLTPDCPKAVHAGPLHQSSGLALVSSELPWKPNTCQVPYSNSIRKKHNNNNDHDEIKHKETGNAYTPNRPPEMGEWDQKLQRTHLERGNNLLQVRVLFLFFLSDISGNQSNLRFLFSLPPLEGACLNQRLVGIRWSSSTFTAGEKLKIS